MDGDPGSADDVRSRNYGTPCRYQGTVGQRHRKEKSILDRCTYDVYREYMANNYEGRAPTMKDLYDTLLKQPESEARGLALSVFNLILSLNTMYPLLEKMQV